MSALVSQSTSVSCCLDQVVVVAAVVCAMVAGVASCRQPQDLAAGSVAKAGRAGVVEDVPGGRGLRNCRVAAWSADVPRVGAGKAVWVRCRSKACLVVVARWRS